MDTKKRAREEATERIAMFPNRVEDVLSLEAASDVAKTILETQATAIVPMPILEELAKSAQAAQGHPAGGSGGGGRAPNPSKKGR
jgi:hypothetical protein